VCRTATKSTYLKGRIVNIYVSALDQRPAGSLRCGEGCAEDTPFRIEFSLINKVL
jgi:hypothetical protein